MTPEEQLNLLVDVSRQIWCVAGAAKYMGDHAEGAAKVVRAALDGDMDAAVWAAQYAKRCRDEAAGYLCDAEVAP